MSQNSINVLSPEWIAWAAPMPSADHLLWIRADSAEESILVSALRERGWNIDVVKEDSVTLGNSPSTVVWQVDAESDHPGEAIHMDALRALQMILLTRPRRLVILTNGTADSTVASAPAQRAAWGIARSLQHENPELSVFSIDVAQHDDLPPDDILACAGALTATQPPHELSIRNGHAFARQLSLRPAPMPQAGETHGSFLVIGSPTFFDVTRNWLLTRGATRVVHGVCATSGEHDDQLVIRDPSRRGVTEALTKAGLDHDLRGIYYGCAPAESSRFEQLGFSEVAETMRDGVLLLRSIDQATRHIPTLREFVAVTDLAASSGAPRRTVSALASAYLEGMIERRRILGRPGNLVVLGQCDQDACAPAHITDGLELALDLNIPWLAVVGEAALVDDLRADGWVALEPSTDAWSAMLPWSDLVAVAAAACECPGGPPDWARRVTRFQVNMHRVVTQEPLKARARRIEYQSGEYEVVRCTLASEDGITVGDVEISFDVS